MSKINLNGLICEVQDSKMLVMCGDADIKKINNSIKNRYKKIDNLKIPIIDSYKVQIQYKPTDFPNIRKHINDKLKISVMIRYYKFESKYEYNKGNIVEGILIHLDHIHT